MKFTLKYEGDKIKLDFEGTYQELEETVERLNPNFNPNIEVKDCKDFFGKIKGFGYSDECLSDEDLKNLTK